MIVRAFAASPEATFNAWLDPLVMHHWMASTPDREIVEIDLCPRTGGDLTIVERAGTRDVTWRGKFGLVIKPRHLAFTLADASGVSLDIEPCAGGCELRLEQRGRRDSWWSAMLDRLAGVLIPTR